jgi:phosphosulfolactate synthase
MAMAMATKAFEMIDIPDRAKKPRDIGLTMVLDKGLGYNAASDLMECAGEYIDVIKLGWGTPRIYPEEAVKKKIQLYRANEIIVSNGGTLFEIAYLKRKVDEFFEYANGGTLFEIAYLKRKVDEFFEYAGRIGINGIEISDGSIEIGMDERADMIGRAKSMGFEVFSEVGKKNPSEDAEFTVEERIHEAKNDLKAGADKVIMEARESGKGIGIFDSAGGIREDMAEKLVKGIGIEDILFEAPIKSQQVYLILKFGIDVSLGNIQPDDVIPLETLRRGLRGDTLGRV